MSSARALNLDQSRISLFGKELNLYPPKFKVFAIDNLDLVQNVGFVCKRKEKVNLKSPRPAWRAEWSACMTHDLVVVSSVPGSSELSFQHVFTSYL